LLQEVGKIVSLCLIGYSVILLQDKIA